MTTLVDLQTPALIVDEDLFAGNLAAMSEAIPGRKLRPHVKAHKCTSIAKRQYELGHTGFTCATIREVEGMAAAGLGDDLLLANEVLDMRRLGALVERGVRVTAAVDSEQTIAAAVAGGVREVVIDVNIGLPRCGCDVADAGKLADKARDGGLEVRGVMGYEGHLMMVQPPEEKLQRTEEALAILLRAHEAAGGDLITSGGTGTYQSNTWANEIQAGSYVLMDSDYGKLGFPFVQAFWILGTVISVSPKWAVLDVGLKALGMDHGNPTLSAGNVMFVADEHLIFVPHESVAVGDRLRVTPAHIDPTIALHETMHTFRGSDVLENWPVDLRGW